MVVERLLARAIAGEDQTATAVVPECEGEHAAEPGDEVEPELLIRVHDRLGVRARGEGVPGGLQLLGELGEVVYLAVEDDGHRPRLVVDRLVSGREVDDAQPPVSEPHPGSTVEAVGIRAAVPDHAGHPAQKARIHRIARIGANQTGDAAHVRRSPVHRSGAWRWPTGASTARSRPAPTAGPSSRAGPSRGPGAPAPPPPGERCRAAARSETTGCLASCLEARR